MSVTWRRKEERRKKKRERQKESVVYLGKGRVRPMNCLILRA